MKRSIAAILIVLLPLTFAFADEVECLFEIQECFSKEDLTKKSNCFYHVSRHNSCKNTESGKVAYKRWAISGNILNENSEDGSALGFLGPVSFDLKCVSSCDNQWLAFIIAGEASITTSKQIDKCITDCIENSSLKTPID